MFNDDKEDIIIELLKDILDHLENIEDKLDSINNSVECI